MPRVLLLLPFACSALGQSITGTTCAPGSPQQSWTYDAASGALSTAQRGGGRACLAAAALPVGDGMQLIMAPCDGGAAQAFDRAPGSLWVARSAPAKCVNLSGYGNASGTLVWLYGCMPSPAYVCQGNCDWEDAGGGALRNAESGLCLDDGDAPPLPPACSPGSAGAGLPFCDYALPFEARARDLVARLNVSDKVALFALPLPVSLPALVNEQLGVAAFYYDTTFIHGLSTTYFIDPLPNATCFPHAIAQAASWDVALAQRIAAAVAYEGRAVHQRNFRISRGRTVQGLNAEGGPLANSVHAPTWGRAQETYGECPHLISAFGVAFTRALQNETGGFLQVSSVARHWLGFHGATDLANAGEEWVTPQWLADQHLPAYRALMVDAASEAVMCSCNTLRIGAGDGAAGGIPACVHPALFHQLREVWNSSALVQGDNEAIFPMFQEHHYYKTLEEAVVGALDAGVAAVDSGGNVQILAAVTAALADGTLRAAMLDAAIERQFVLRMRVGEFDAANPAFPFAGPYDEAQIDGAAHRALAREAVAKSATLLRNAGGALPLSAAAPPASVAVIGPWADSGDRFGSYGCNEGYMGNYAATTSVVSTIFGALAEELAGRSNVSFAAGTAPMAIISPTGIADAAALARASELTVLALGLGCAIETEGVDRPYLYLPPPQDALLAAVAAAVRARRTAGQAAALVLVTVSANVADLDAALADAWLQLFIPGEEAGHGLADVLFGRAAPSGRLPLTVYANEYLVVSGPTADFNMVSQSTGVGRTYRFADRIPDALVKYKFGFGLSYARFEYAELAATVGADGAVNVTFTVRNLGGFSLAREVCQLYVSVPAVAGLATPVLALRGFAVQELAAGAPATHVAMTLPNGAFVTTDAEGGVAVTGGSYQLYVSGHQPNDAMGEAQSNTLTTAVALPPSARVEVASLPRGL